MVLVFLWLSLALALAFAELFLPSLLVFLSLAMGALLAGLTACFVEDFIVQAGVFLLASLVGGCVIYRQTKSNKLSCLGKVHGYETNVFALVGMLGQVVVDFQSDGCGYVVVEHERWFAMSQEEGLRQGDIVKIVDVVGNKLVVIKES